MSQIIIRSVPNAGFHNIFVEAFALLCNFPGWHASCSSIKGESGFFPFSSVWVKSSLFKGSGWPPEPVKKQTPALLAGVYGLSGGSCFVFTTPVEEPSTIVYFVRR
jgi:hypothetical protein